MALNSCREAIPVLLLSQRVFSAHFANGWVSPIQSAEQWGDTFRFYQCGFSVAALFVMAIPQENITVHPKWDTINPVSHAAPSNGVFSHLFCRKAICISSVCKPKLS